MFTPSTAKPKGLLESSGNYIDTTGIIYLRSLSICVSLYLYLLEKMILLVPCQDLLSTHLLDSLG